MIEYTLTTNYYDVKEYDAAIEKAKNTFLYDIVYRLKQGLDYTDRMYFDEEYEANKDDRDELFFALREILKKEDCQFTVINKYSIFHKSWEIKVTCSLDKILGKFEKVIKEEFVRAHDYFADSVNFIYPIDVSTKYFWPNDLNPTLELFSPNHFGFLEEAQKKRIIELLCLQTNGNIALFNISLLYALHWELHKELARNYLKLGRKVYAIEALARGDCFEAGKIYEENGRLNEAILCYEQYHPKEAFRLLKQIGPEGFKKFENYEPRLFDGTFECIIEQERSIELARVMGRVPPDYWTGSKEQELAFLLKVEQVKKAAKAKGEQIDENEFTTPISLEEIEEDFALGKISKLEYDKIKELRKPKQDGFCLYCGKETKTTFAFCPSCGKQVKSDNKII